MSRRITKCLTWGETHRRGFPLLGGRVGYVDLAEYITLCGKPEEDPKYAVSLEYRKPRPTGICPACWAKLRVAMISAEISGR